MKNSELVLSTEEVRPGLLTDKECAGTMLGLAGSLILISNAETVRRAMRYLAEQDSIWQQLSKYQTLGVATVVEREPSEQEPQA